MENEFTVGDLIKALSDLPKDLPVYFGATFTHTAIYKDEYGDRIEHEAEFSDWLEFGSTEIMKQTIRENGELHKRDVAVLEMVYENP